MNQWLQPTLVMKQDSKTINRIFTVLSVLVAVAMFVAAAGSGSGNPAVAEPLPAWVDIAANVVSALIGIFVLLPRTRALASILAVVNMLISMIVNYRVDGVDYFVQVSPFNITTIIVASILLGHYAEDLVNLFRSE